MPSPGKTPEDKASAEAEDVDPSSNRQLLEKLLSTPATSTAHTSLPSVYLGQIVGFIEGGLPLVVCSASGTGKAIPVIASCVAVDLSHVGRGVTLQFVEGDPQRPVIAGILEAFPAASSESDTPTTSPEITVDGKKAAIVGKKQIELRTGKASITLTSAGKIIIEGAYILTRSSGANHVKGASLKLN